MSETERDRAIFTKFFTRRLPAESTGNFTQNRFPAIFGGHFEFLHKIQKINKPDSSRKPCILS